jgi:hypothetical protein
MADERHGGFGSGSEWIWWIIIIFVIIIIFCPGIFGGSGGFCN